MEDPSKTWIKVYGLHDIEKLKTIWSYFDLHPLIQEDIVSTQQRPKMEQYENCIYFVLRALHLSDGQEETLDTEQISIVLGDNFVLSFQESDKPWFGPILDRLRIENSRIRQRGPDYLAYAMMDTVVDHYFSLLEALGDETESLEDILIEDPSPESFHHLHQLRRTFTYFRKTVWPLRDVLNSTIRDDSPHIREETGIFLRDVYDHVVHIIDNVENYRDILMGLHDMYMSHVSNKMNEVMKVLTIIATIFIPLTFIAGIYGMNFDPGASPWNMPELGWYWGYPAAMALMAAVTVGMLIYFRRKDWL
ncbi:MAG: magnesium/cobalt transporter CorA [Balneolaceae bacterium]|nr:magnesium/cobalt transporter CorA [Balneolaceae bacterium]